MKLKGLIFDWDGTLANTLPVCFGAFRRALGEFTGRYYTDKQVEALFGPSEDGCIRNVVGDRWREAFDVYLAEYDRIHVLCPEPAPAMVNALTSLKNAGVKLAIVTGKSAKSLDISLRKLNIRHPFDATEAGSIDGCFKSLSMIKVLAEWDLSPSEVGYVGDSPVDMVESRKAGVVPLAAAWFDTADCTKLLAKNPTALFHTVKEMIDWLSNS